MKANDINTTSDIDRLGILLAEIDRLTKEANGIKDTLKDVATLPGGPTEFIGNLFRAIVIESNRSAVDYKAIMEKYEIPTEVVAEFTKTTAVFSVKTTSR